MKFISTDGKVFNINLGKYLGKENNNPSDLHIRIRSFLKENFPSINILEEVYVERERLYLDFYLTRLNICVEGMGNQHSYFSLYMHKDKLSFARAKGRDNRKAEFCRINNIKLVYFYPNEDIDEWKMKLGLKI